MAVLAEEHPAVPIYSLLDLLAFSHLKVYEQLTIVLTAAQRILGKRDDLLEEISIESCLNHLVFI